MEQMIGNAVPVNLANYVANAINTYIKHADLYVMLDPQLNIQFVYEGRVEYS